MDFLPTELLSKIFEYLDGQGLVCASQVCKRWHNLRSYESLELKRLTLKFKNLNEPSLIFMVVKNVPNWVFILSNGDIYNCLADNRATITNLITRETKILLDSHPLCVWNGKLLMQDDGLFTVYDIINNTYVCFENDIGWPTVRPIFDRVYLFGTKGFYLIDNDNLTHVESDIRFFAATKNFLFSMPHLTVEIYDLECKKVDSPFSKAERVICYNYHYLLTESELTINIYRDEGVRLHKISSINNITILGVLSIWKCLFFVASTKELKIYHLETGSLLKVIYQDDISDICVNHNKLVIESRISTTRKVLSVYDISW